MNATKRGRMHKITFSRGRREVYMYQEWECSIAKDKYDFNLELFLYYTPMIRMYTCSCHCPGDKGAGMVKM